MKRICSFVLVLGLIVSLSACGKVEITMQEIYDANLTETLLKSHESIYVRDEVNGEFYAEKHVTKEYVYEYIHEEDFDWVEFTTDDARYWHLDGDYIRLWVIAPDGVSSDFVSYRAERYPSVTLSPETVDETIESVSKEDGRITVTSGLTQKALENLAEDGVTAGKFEYVLDAKTYEVISAINDYTFDDGTPFYAVSEVSYNAEAPEWVKTFLEYDNQTEDLRNVTVVTNPGTEKEVSQSLQTPKGLIIGFVYDEEYEFEVYADAACTELYDPYMDTDSDQTIYVKWVE